MAKHEELIKSIMHPQLECECITKPWHQRLGANACSLVLVLVVKLVIDGKPKILYEGILPRFCMYQGDETIVVV
jgi:hypothetical protein